MKSLQIFVYDTREQLSLHAHKLYRSLNGDIGDSITKLPLNLDYEGKILSVMGPANISYTWGTIMGGSLEPTSDLIISHYGSSFVQQYISAVRQDGSDSPDVELSIPFLNENIGVLLWFLLYDILWGRFDNSSSKVLKMAWRLLATKPFFKPTMTRLSDASCI